MKLSILPAFAGFLAATCLAGAKVVWQTPAVNGSDAFGANHCAIQNMSLAVLKPMEMGRFFFLGALALMAVATIAIFLLRILGILPKGNEADGGPVVACLSLLGALGFLTGLGLAVYASKYEKLGLALAALSTLAVAGSIFINRRKSRRR